MAAATGDLPMASSALSPLHHPNSCIDPNDIDSYINYEQTNSYLSPSPSSSAFSSASQTTHAPSSQSVPSTGGQQTSTTPSQQVLYSAPSHQYDSYKQQTGLPMGGLADTMAINRNMGMNYAMPASGGTYGFQPEGMVPINAQSEQMMDGDFQQRQQQSLPFRDTEMDGEGDISLHDMSGYAFPSQNPVKAEFVDPNALGGHEFSPAAAPPQPAGRVYPGIHQQQAARVKAAQQQKQQELLRRRQQQQPPQQQQQQQPQQPQQSQSQSQSSQQTQEQQQPQEQQQAPADRQQQQQESQGQAQAQQGGHSRNASRSSNKGGRTTDPVVEERISRLLQQMRQSSTASAEEAHTPSQTLPQIAKQKKEEEDMDEDERLLASEEGKKLSSKERRQLRNKVSARAFRSRRKEYIGQLEGEVTAKTNEANDVRLQNRALMEENTRLTDLTRMLLSSPHFASFLNDVGTNGLPVPSQNQQAPVAQQAARPQVQNDASQDVQMPTPPNGLPAIPEQQGFDFAALDVNGPGWNSGIDMNFNNNASVFAVLDVPEGPAIDSIDTEALSGKDSSFAAPLPFSDAKDDIPILERPALEETDSQAKLQPACPAVDVDESDPSLALFLDQPPTQPTAAPSESSNLFGGIPSEKAFARIDLVSDDDAAKESAGITHATMARFQRLCASIEAPYQRVCRATSHLDS